MAIKRIPVPFCDCCKEPWLPKHRRADGTINPVFDHPERSKRCGKCKRTRWNSGGIDRRRKQTVENPVEAGEAQEAADEGTEEVHSEIAAAPTGRCKHGFYKCPQCHPEKAA